MYINVSFDLMNETTDVMERNLKKKFARIQTFKYNRFVLKGKFSSDDEVQEVKQFVEDNGIEIESIFRENIYERPDIPNFEYFFSSGQIIPNSTIEFVEKDVLNDKTFDLTDFCPVCQLRKEQIGPLKLKGVTLPVFKKSILTPFWTYWLIRNDAKEKLENSDLTGVEFLPIHNYKDEIVKCASQLKPSNCLKEMLFPDTYVKNYNVAPKSRGTCNCDHYYIHYREDNLVLREDKKKDLLDFNELYERSVRGFPGLYILSQKFVLFLMDELGIRQNKDMVFYPVSFK